MTEEALKKAKDLESRIKILKEGKSNLEAHVAVGTPYKLVISSLTRARNQIYQEIHLAASEYAALSEQGKADATAAFYALVGMTCLAYAKEIARLEAELQAL